MGLTAKALVALARRCHQQPWLVLGLTFLVLGISVFLSARHLNFESDRGALIGSNDELFNIQERFLTEFPESDDIVITVSGQDRMRRELFVDDLARSLAEHPDYFHDVFSRLEFPFLRDRALYYLDQEDLKRLVESLTEARPLLMSLSSDQGLAGLLDGFGESAGSNGFGRVLPFLNQVIEQLLVSLSTRGRFEYHSPWGALFFGADDGQGPPSELREPGRWIFYNTLGDGSTHLVLLRYNKAKPDLVPKLRSIIQRTHKPYPKLRVGLTGEVVLEHDETVSSEHDSQSSAVRSIILVTVLFAVAFRAISGPLIAILALAVGVVWTLGFTTLSIGHLNLLTVSFATILIGLGIDFGIHFLFRYEEEYVKVADPLKAMEQTMLGTGVENFVGALSTAIAFWAVGFAGFKGVAEIGIIAGTGVMLCYLSMATVLVSLVLLRDRNRGGYLRNVVPEILGRIETQVLSRSWLVLLVAVGVTLWSVLQIPFVGFDYNLLRLQDPNLDSVQAELELIETSDRTVLFAVSLADDVESALELGARYERLPSVSRAESVGPLFPHHVEAKSEYVAQVQKLMEGVRIKAHHAHLSGAGDLKDMANGFLELEHAFRSAYPALLKHESPEVREQAVKFNRLLEQLFATLQSMGPGPIEDGLEAFTKNFFGDLETMVDFLRSQRVGGRLEISELPPNLQVRSQGITGKLVVRVYPRANIWEREALEKFVRDLRTVDPEVIGAPVMILHHTTQLKHAFETSGLYALVAIVVILLVHFRSLKLAAVAILPLVMGVAWMLGIMRLGEIGFNPANFMGLPLILGIGLDFGIHVVHRASEEGDGRMFTHSTGPATLVSALTTICGFGTLALAGHQGIASLGFVLTAGVASTTITALLVLPAVLQVTGVLSRAPESKS